ncbi:heavy-metal-associated domain-containing protein [Desulfobaculum bizertense]|uniref:heavy-metal-associated domain-containing protein n=1 Tax=Desulfobaculum bizertense TaxID=376490 RepID=UPI001F19C588|nr:heavy metal-associated domain-containing protein [Desulfobaculum bizertense]UIJ38109.1 heavy-metal-associated domain-containing protein [Desulfobaculum bizertense]
MSGLTREAGNKLKQVMKLGKQRRDNRVAALEKEMGKSLYKLVVKGMSCQHCVAAVTEALTKVSGLSSVSVDLEKGVASFYSDSEPDYAVLKDAVESIGFDAGDLVQ